MLPIKAPDVTSSRTERERDLGDAVSLRDLIRGMPALSCVVDCAATCFALHDFFSQYIYIFCIIQLRQLYSFIETHSGRVILKCLLILVSCL